MSDKTVYYVIVGRGYGAAVNFSTLRLTAKDRFVRDGQVFPVLLIGGPDPWDSFRRHDMGQHPMLLTLPGYCVHPDLPAADQEKFLSSKDFANVTRDQYNALREYGFQELDGEVTAIVEDGDLLKLTVKAGDTDQIITAAYVDICTGVGESSLPKNIVPGLDDTVVTEMQRDGVIRLAGDFLREPDPVTKSKNVCIIGGGPVASICCEFAIRDGASSIFWVADDMFEGAFPGGGRFDWLRRDDREDTYYVPASSRVTIASSYLVKIENSPLGISLEEHPPASGRSRGRQYTHLGRQADPLLNLPVECVIIATGQRNKVLEFTGLLAKDYTAINGVFGGIAVAATAYNEKLRLLGAAALTHSELSQVSWWLAPHKVKPLAKHMHEQIDVPDGKPYLSVPIAARFIAEANGYFESMAPKSGPNWNAASDAHMRLCLGMKSIDYEETQLDSIIAKRRKEILAAPQLGCGQPVYTKHDAGAYLNVATPGPV